MRSIFMQACRNDFAGCASSHSSGGQRRIDLDLAYKRSTFYRQFAATHGNVRCLQFR
jgi:hypothetical protein